jgi:hypothetical protein
MYEGTNSRDGVLPSPREVCYDVILKLRNTPTASELERAVPVHIVLSGDPIETWCRIPTGC